MGCPSADPDATGQDTGSTSSTAATSNGDGDGATSMVLPTTTTPTVDPDTGGETTIGTVTNITATSTTGEGSTDTDTGDPVEPVPCQPGAGQDGPVVVGLQSVAGTQAADDFGVPGAGGGGAFIPNPDGGGTNVECDLWSQDCPMGEKCMAWANDGGGSWNASRCSPIAENPNQPGDECMVEGSGVSGIDNCDIGSMCFGVNGETNVGTCVEMCSGSPQAPVCDTPDTTCTISNDGFLILCRPICNPLADECAANEGCYPVGDIMVCAPDASGDGGAPGDPCEFINACQPGNFCGTGVPNCAGSGCCSPFCQLGDDGPCLDGQVCLPSFPGDAPAECLEDVGQCTAP